MNEELRRQIRERRDEHAKKFQRTASSADSEARRALEWVLDLLAAQPAAVSLPEEAEPITVERLAAVIREVDGNHSLGAGALAEAILAALAPSPLPVVTAERQEALLTMLDGCEEAARIYEEQIAAIEANERAVDRWIAGAPAVSLELPEPPACDSCAVTLETLALWPCVIDGCREYVTVHVPGYPDCTNRCAAHHREVFDPDDQVAIALPSTEPPIEDAGSGGVR